MPRKASKKEKPPLLFLERSICGSRVRNAPEVRAALNPREFFTETEAANSSSFSKWVSPQFDATVPVPPPRRGRRKCQSATSILDNSSQVSRQNSVCKFPALSFQTRSSVQPHQPKHTKKANTLSSTGNQPQGLRQHKKTVQNVQCLETPKRHTSSVRKRNRKRGPDAAASTSRCLDGAENPSIHVTEEPCLIPAVGSSILALNNFSTTDVSSVSPPPDVDTPKAIQEGIDCPPSTSFNLLLPQPSTPPCNQPPDILVADTPERDYGLKVTWRRRRALMLLLKERKLLSDLDVLIPS